MHVCKAYCWDITKIKSRASAVDPKPHKVSLEMFNVLLETICLHVPFPRLFPLIVTLLY